MVSVAGDFEDHPVPTPCHGQQHSLLPFHSMLLSKVPFLLSWSPFRYWKMLEGLPADLNPISLGGIVIKISHWIIIALTTWVVLVHGTPVSYLHTNEFMLFILCCYLLWAVIIARLGWSCVGHFEPGFWRRWACTSILSVSSFISLLLITFEGID